MTDEPSGANTKRTPQRSRQMGVSFPLERWIEEQMADQKEMEEKTAAGQGPTAPPVERFRSEVYGMPVDTIIESAKQAFPPAADKAEAPAGAKPPADPLPEQTWSSIEDQMANPVRGGGRTRRR